MYTIDQYNSLKSAIALGSTEVHYGDKKVIYRSLQEMLEILAIMTGELNPDATEIAGQPSRRRVAAFSKGL